VAYKANPLDRLSYPEPDAPMIGYARVSTLEQNPQLQIDALLRAGVHEPDIWVEHASGAAKKRPVLEAMLKDVRRGDVIVIWKMDRLGRRLAGLIDLIDGLNSRGVFLKVLDNTGLDTTTAAGRAVFQILGAVAELELNLTRERTKAGLQAARERGRFGGRRFEFSDEQILEAFSANRGNLSRAAASLRYKFKGEMRSMSVAGFKKALDRAQAAQAAKETDNEPT
jgi:DNA invertase Pin-like site-specific DNA recombinase